MLSKFKRVFPCFVDVSGVCVQIEPLLLLLDRPLGIGGVGPLPREGLLDSDEAPMKPLRLMIRTLRRLNLNGHNGYVHYHEVFMALHTAHFGVPSEVMPEIMAKHTPIFDSSKLRAHFQSLEMSRRKTQRRVSQMSTEQRQHLTMLSSKAALMDMQRNSVPGKGGASSSEMAVGAAAAAKLYNQQNTSGMFSQGVVPGLRRLWRKFVETSRHLSKLYSHQEVYATKARHKVHRKSVGDLESLEYQKARECDGKSARHSNRSGYYLTIFLSGHRPCQRKVPGLFAGRSDCGSKRKWHERAWR